MPVPNVILLQSDPIITKSLVDSLSNSFRVVHAVWSLDDLRSSVAKHRARIVVLDVETVRLSDVQQLSHEFPDVHIVCNHRLADDELWTAALSAGASDCYPSSATQAIVDATRRYGSMARSATA